MGWLSPSKPILKTERLLLRPPAKSDWQEWAALREQSREYLIPWEPYWGPNHLSERSYRQRFIAKAKGEVSQSFFLFQRDGGQLLGGVTISNIRYGVAQMASFGYWLGQPHIGQGYMTEGLNRLVTYLFDDMYLHRIEAACIPNNMGSRRLLEKLGFREEGHVKQYLKINGKWCDHVLYGLLREDHKAQ